MNDKGLSVLEQYDLQVLRFFKGRGAMILETAQGLKVLREVDCSVNKVQFQNRVLTHMKNMGIHRIDCFVKNKDGELITKDRDGTCYVVKDWFEGKECDVRDIAEVKKAVANLAMLHTAMQLGNEQDILADSRMEPYQLQSEFERHTKELKRVRNFMRDKSQKSGFEVYYVQYYNIFYDSVLMVEEQMKKDTHQSVCDEIMTHGLLCHGDYNYHNIIMEKQGIATINFEKMVLDLQVRDLYQFMRKILEKNDWSLFIGMEMLEAYEAQRKLSDMEKRSLYLRLSYPEKFWKISNYYQNSNKAWIPEKNTEKLKKLVEQEEKKQKFLEALSVRA